MAGVFRCPHIVAPGHEVPYNTVVKLIEGNDRAINVQ